MTTSKKIEELERQLAEARQVGLNVLARADKWRAALTKISQRSRDLAACEIAHNALLDI